MTCDSIFQRVEKRGTSTEPVTVGKRKRGMMVGVGKGWKSRETGDGGALKKHSFCYFPKARFPSEDERTVKGDRPGQWERKWDDLCHPTKPKAAMMLCCTCTHYAFCKYFPFTS